MQKGICVVAIGGNAILSENDHGTIDEQIENIQIVCKKIVELIQQGYQVIITHGNGPQVGQTLLRHKLSANIVSEGTLDGCGAETQGLLGYLIQQVLRNELEKAGLSLDVAAIVTQVVVDKKDKAFQDPTKPIGPFYSKDEAEEVSRKYDRKIIEDSGRGYRMVVPSPIPVDIVEKNTILSLLKSGSVVIAAGGGGIPVVRQDNGLVGVAAVIDKDAASSLLARMIGADYLLLLTGVEKVCINYRQPNESQLNFLPVWQAEQYLAEGQFPEGSMAPKIRAAIEFVKFGGTKAIITNLNNICEALQGETGTAIGQGDKPTVAEYSTEAIAEKTIMESCLSQ
ncbi:Carbamate kinase 1 [Sporomusa silvacetica DSM 10669]|uniref:Carbamate kinase n=1 Tax=Sporomusa silvacetica DSM 10669 TaxID=1123289 RepID=A0ABZ3INB9_9FIRM|nr:carbamate kinase [Sporomusa silvacetica]OZC14701.1 carbamate kinase 1 [Sporomusa silvacetica DSM 10669]